MNVNDTFQSLNIGLPDDILRRKLHGDFAGAIRLIDLRLKDEGLPRAMRACLTAQREIIRRLPEQFPYSREEAIAIIRNHIPDFGEETFDAYVDQRKIRWAYVDGQLHVVDDFFETLCKADPAFAVRAGVKKPSSTQEPDLTLITMEQMRQRGSLTRRIRIRATLHIRDEHFTPGMFVRAHLPIPAACQQQRDIRIEAVFPANGRIAPEDAPQRTVCWEETMTENHEFSVEYSYLHTAVFTDAYHLSGQPGSLTDFTQEEPPHIVFTPYIRALCAELTEGLEDPMAKARAFYDFITRNMKYTFMPAYFVLDSIADSCAKNYTGDCGVFALLFITLCRCAGIPAQWQSGLTAEPDFCGCHDWARFYVEPYGWLFADPSYGIAAVRNGREAQREFYFGNLDPYRMVANSRFQADFTVPKAHWRNDPYDNQTGEMETLDRPLDSGAFDRTHDILSCEEV